MERDLTSISIVKRSKVISRKCTALSIEPCIINGENVIIKTHRTKETYKNEKRNYFLLKNENFLPKLIYFDDKNLKLLMTDVGNALPLIEKINLKDYENELVNILNIMQYKYNIFHNDLRPKNICIDENNNIKLIDFDNAREKQIAGEDNNIFKSAKYDFPKFYF